MRICYLIPEFPGQTHAFFWREAEHLAKLGGEPVFISTRKPPRGIKSHTWGPKAEASTTYLSPLKVGEVFQTLCVLLGVGPIGWFRALYTALCEAEGGIRDRARNILLIVMAARLVRVMRRAGSSRLHVHSCADALMVATLAHRLAGVTYGLTLHGDLHGYGPNQKVKWGYASYAIVITRTLMKQVSEVLGDSLPELIAIAPMGVVVEEFKRSAPYLPYRGAGPARLFCCGRLHRFKGQMELIKAIALLCQKGIDVVAHVAGEDEQGGTGYHKKLDETIEELGLTDRVKLLGAVDEARISRELEEAHVFVLPTLKEALGVAIMEAMAMQTPVVTTRLEGIQELVEDGVDGLLVEAKQIESLAEQIGRLLADPALAEYLSASSRAKIETQFNSGLSAQVIMSLAGRC